MRILLCFLFHRSNHTKVNTSYLWDGSLAADNYVCNKCKREWQSETYEPESQSDLVEIAPNLWVKK